MKFDKYTDEYYLLFFVVVVAVAVVVIEMFIFYMFVENANGHI